MRCPSCDLAFKSYTAVSLHFRNKHGTAAQFGEIMRRKLVEEKHAGVEPTCKCGCGTVTRYYDYEKGYVEYAKGHHARVHNNWGHNEKALQKSQDVRRQQIMDGVFEPWNRGLTSEVDERVAAYGKVGSRTIRSNPEELIRRASAMSDQWQTGAIVPLTGSAHSGWKGGVSSVQALCRSYVFNAWTYPKLLSSNFTCQKCGAQGNLEVHHDQERFAQILQKARLELGDVTGDFASHQAYARWVADYHLQHDVSGIVLCEACHQSAHHATK
jgi:hypothetical protein